MSFPRSVFVSSWFTVMTAGEVGYREVGKTCSTRALELWVRLQRGTCRRGVQGSQRWVRVHTCSSFVSTARGGLTTVHSLVCPLMIVELQSTSNTRI